MKSSVAILVIWILVLVATPVAARPPSFVIFLADDLGFSDLSSYGGELATPAIDGIGQRGFRFRQFYATPRCSPTRAALLTGRQPHEAGMAHLADMRTDHPAYQGELRADVPTLPERLRPAGYRSYMVGKWHLDFRNDPASSSAPIARGFDRFYGVMRGAEDYYRPRSLSRDARLLPEPRGDFYLTDRLAEEAAVYLRDHAAQTPDQPFFLYVAFTAPHWPVQAPPTDLSRAAGLYDQGWDRVREARAPRLRRVLQGDWQTAPRDAAVPPWEDADHPGWQRARMEAYAGALHALDRGVATVLAALRETGHEDDTVVAFLSDNGGSPEELSQASRWLREAAGLFSWEHYGDDPSKSPGPPDSFQSYGRAWSNVSNAPFQGHKAGLYEGGIASPLLISLPTRTGTDGVAVPLDRWLDKPAHVTDLSATILELAGASAPPEEMAGESLVPLVEGRPWDRNPIFWEHEGWRAVRDGDLKAVAPFGGVLGGLFGGPFRQDWELYDLGVDRTEQHDLAGERPADLARLVALHDAWAERVGVQPWPWVLPFARRVAYGVAGAGTFVLGIGVLLLWRRLSRL